MYYTETTRQQGVETRDWILQVIKSYITAHGYPPTVREICGMIGVKSTSTVHGHIRRMIADGVLETDADMSPRAIRVPGMRIIFEEVKT